MVTRSWRPLVFVAGETGLLVMAVIAGSYLRLGGDAWVYLADPAGFVRVLAVVLACQMCLYYADLYEFGTVKSMRDLLVKLCRAFGAMSLILAVAYFWFPDLIIGRGVFVLSALIAIAAVLGWRLAFGWLSERIRPRERLLLVGTNPAAVDLARELFDRRQELGVEIVGFVDPDPSRIGTTIINPAVVGAIADIPTLVHQHRIDRVVVSLADARGRLPMEKLLDIRVRTGVTFDHLASVYEDYTGKIALENLRPSWLIFSAGFKKTRGVLAAKRTLDLVAALIGLSLTAPLLLIIAALVKVTSHGPVLYHQDRVGLNGRIIWIHKFRTMRDDAEARTGPVWSSADDDRVTTVGRFLRKCRLDELPQLWNVLRGEMSVVGPRPERPPFVAQLTQDIPFYGQRHVVKPGITGWAQIRYTYGASVEDAIQKLQYDLYYIKNLSVALDFVIILETFKTVVLRRGAR